MTKIGFWFDYDQTYTFTQVFNEVYRTNSNITNSLIYPHSNF